MQPEIVVNGRFLARRTTGVERYAGEILARLGSGVRIARPGRPAYGSGRPAGHAWEQFILPARLPRGAVLWSPANTGPLSVANQALTLHDLSALEHPEWYTASFSLWYRLLLPGLVRRVRRVITSSEFVRRKVLRHFGLPEERVSVVPGGVDTAHFHPLESQPERQNYVLFVGSLEPRKNLPVLLQAWESISARYPHIALVIAGASEPVFRPVDLPGGPQPARRVRWSGYAAESDLPALYAGAAAFVLPSLDEGFGLTAVEAMACGAPVIASAAGALPEVLGDAGLCFDPARPAALAAALEEVLCRPELRRELRRRGLERARHFSWSAAAAQTRRLLEELDVV